MDDVQFNILIDTLTSIAENLRRIAFEIEKLEESKKDESV